MNPTSELTKANQELELYLGITNDKSWEKSYWGLGYFFFPYSRTHYSVIKKIKDENISSIEDLIIRLKAVNIKSEGALSNHIKTIEGMVPPVNYSPGALAIAAFLNYFDYRPINSMEKEAVKKLYRELSIYIQPASRLPFDMNVLIEFNYCLRNIVKNLWDRRQLRALEYAKSNSENRANYYNIFFGTGQFEEKLLLGIQQAIEFIPPGNSERKVLEAIAIDIHKYRFQKRVVYDIEVPDEDNKQARHTLMALC